jgi:hypothetical protein
MANNDSIKVSHNFIEIYRNFNVSDQREKMNELSKAELYLLLDSCIDNHDDEDSTVQLNFSPFMNELKEILNLQSGEVSNPILEDLQNKAGLKISNIRISENGDNLPEPYTREQVRDLKINKIFDK